jgi:hypothetical protein
LLAIFADAAIAHAMLCWATWWHCHYGTEPPTS